MARSLLLLHTYLKERGFIAAWKCCWPPSLRLSPLLTYVHSLGRVRLLYRRGDGSARRSRHSRLFLRFFQPLLQPFPGSEQRFMAHFERGDAHDRACRQNMSLNERFPGHFQGSRLLGIDEIEV